jgi:hypothetical protein
MARIPNRIRLALAAVLSLTAGSGCEPTDLSGYEVVLLAPGPDLEARAREALILAKPGTVVEFPVAPGPSATSSPSTPPTS